MTETQHFERLNAKITQMLVSLEQVKTKLDNFERVLSGADAKVDDHERRLTQLEGTVNSQRKIFWAVIPAVVVALLIGFIESGVLN